MSFFVKIITRRSPDREPETDDAVMTLPEVFHTQEEAEAHAEACLRSGLYAAETYTYEVTDGRGDTVLKPGS